MKFYILALAMLLMNAVAEDTPADVMARNILEWIQGIYRQGTRKTRQQSDSNAYLPPLSTQRPPERPRPFQPASTQQPPPYSNPSQNEIGGFPDYGSGPSLTTVSTTGRPNYSPSSAGNTGYNPQTSFGSSAASAASSFGGYPSTSTTYLPPTQSSSPIGSGYPYPSPGSRPTPGFPTPGRPVSPPGPPAGQTPGRPGPTSGPTPGPSSGLSPRPMPGSAPSSQPEPTSGSNNGPAVGPAPSPTSAPGAAPGSIPGSAPAPAPGPDGDEDNDLKHPPHIHSLDVICSKTMMIINIEFNRAFDGIIYSKGFYNMPACRYVEQNSGQTKYSFTVNLDSCGTQFINDFEGEAGQAYLENVLVLQNEPGIQEVWDTVRSVRCLWEGNINKALKVSLSVDMLNQEIVTFSGDTAMAKLDIQVGKGPFAPAANGLVKIGDPMTLVVSVEGDPAFDLQVRDCIARDESGENMYQLTDERGCILKPKLFGAFQKTNDTGNTGASIIAYAFFQAFKFPDVMDLFIECNVELCKTNCEPCPEANQQIEPGRRRRRRSVSYPVTGRNWTREYLHGEAVRVGRSFRVVMLDDLPHDTSGFFLENGETSNSERQSQQLQQQLQNPEVAETTVALDVCLSYTGFYVTCATILVALAFSSISAALFYAKLQLIRYEKRLDMPVCS